MVQLVWFKRDLRVHDHTALSAAAERGPVCALYIVEPELWVQADASYRHFAFLCECLVDLREELAKLDVTLTLRVGSAVDVISTLHVEIGIEAIHAHEETGNNWTYARDNAVRDWARQTACPFHEYPQFGVIRGGVDRDGWSKLWERQMAQPLAEFPRGATSVQLNSEPMPAPSELGLSEDGCVERQSGGRKVGKRLLDSFFTGRSRKYRSQMSSPLTAQEACSRLSPYLAFGCLSMREVVQTAYMVRDALGHPDQPEAFDITKGSLSSFIARLHWHCHFIQKLETEPGIEQQTFHPAFNTARARVDADNLLLQAWASGRTGFPFIDACMRSLIATGWINFRMRAMLMSFASYHLWLDWRDTGLVLARYFTDYEPGIHWSQCQMQSGTTGINTLRIYNPVKQSIDQDPDGVFIRRWVPELKHVKTDYIHQPWVMAQIEQAKSECLIGTNYPEPVVNHELAAREARSRMTTLRRSEGFYDQQREVYHRHGSRKGPRQNRMWKVRKEHSTRQLDLEL